MIGYNVLSLFGGIETGYAALKDAGVPIANYWSSEIDKNAIKAAKWNYPEIVHIGDVKNVKVSELPFVPDLLIGGFPCQDLSVAGKQAGLDGERSGLFFEAVRILRECQAVNPDVLFLFENVPMAKRYEHVISQTLGVCPWRNNAALVSAQNRNRLWWSNIRTRWNGQVTDFPQPEDMGITLADILENDVDEKYFLSAARLKTMISRIGKHTQIDADKSMCFTTRTDAGWSGEMITVKVNRNGKEKSNQPSADCFTAGANSGGNHSDMDLICEYNPVGTALRRQIKNGAVQPRTEEYRKDGKANCVTQFQELSCVSQGQTLRRLTPVEVCRLFTLPDDFFQTPDGLIIAETNQYKVLGNGWVMKVVSHIFSFLPELQ
jgi:DNA (cytosine-5)-methyltransferase 3A